MKFADDAALLVERLAPRMHQQRRLLHQRLHLICSKFDSIQPLSTLLASSQCSRPVRHPPPRTGSAATLATVTSTVASQTVIVSGSSTSTVGSNSTASGPTGSRTTTGTGADATTSGAATETTAAGGDSAAGRIQAAGWAIAGVIAAAVAL
ncbi:predicted protein [Verticillium alfalfae VaMs.102]|uniref:Predicted protein n=1 Tax=Verticillium alfalfae (strain VaMs.102 / ATCC MYA-4576 / FGSC 10136) TaxID=526221 RepID=C9S9E7_VERA1|nr:predicted protein [Verticillium alfalfae VaMs.102]EEY16010.1 predicted protein [Verticillium alfalfae VaMs.102]